MQRIDRDHFPTRPAVVTIGNFDGVHIGHQALLSVALREAKERGGDMVVMTFAPHPMSVLRPESPVYLITPIDLKLYYLGLSGVKWVDILPFSQDIAIIPPLAFLELYLVQRLHVKAIVIGYNFTFGAGGLGNASTIEEWGRSRQVAVHVVEPVKDGAHVDAVVSSTLIRGLIREGRVNEARQFLGHPFAVMSPVYSGDARGRTMGIPTANLVPPPDQIMPPFGVYAGFLHYDQGRVPAVANWGIRPTFGGTNPVLEVHILIDQNWSFSGSVRFDFIDYLRPEQKFGSTADLINQIQTDIVMAKRVLETVQTTP